MIYPELLLFFISIVSAASYTSKGCYAFSDLKSVLESQGSYTYQTNAYCQGLCSGKKVAATLNGSTCYCGDSLPSSVKSVSSSNCDVVCQGYGTEICGGDGYLSVFYSEDAGDDDATKKSASSSKSASSASPSSRTSSTSTSTSSSTTSTSSSTTSTSSSDTTTSSANTSTSTSSTTSSTIPTSTSETSSSTVLVSTQIITTILTTASNTVQTLTQTIEITPASDTSTSTSSADSDSTSNASTTNRTLSGGAIAGIAIGSVVAASSILGVLIFIFLNSRRSRRSREDGFEGDSVTDSSFNSNKTFNDTSIMIDFGRQYNESGVKRLSNGSLSDLDQGHTLRVVNPDE